MIFITLKDGSVQLKAELEDKNEINFGLELGTIIGDDFRKRFEGPYEVKPKVIEQVLETNEKVMEDDVTVFAIPIYEVTNPQGGKTVTIGE